MYYELSNPYQPIHDSPLSLFFKHSLRYRFPLWRSAVHSKHIPFRTHRLAGGTQTSWVYWPYGGRDATRRRSYVLLPKQAGSLFPYTSILMKVFKRVFTYKLVGVPGEIRILDTMIKSHVL